MPSSEPALERLFAVLLSDDESGKPKFSKDTIITYLPLLMQSAGLTLDHSEKSTQALFDHIAQLVGASPQDSDEVLARKLADYYRAHPPPKELEQAFARFCQEDAGVAASDAFDSKHKAAKETPHVPVTATKAVFDVRDAQSDDSSREP